MNFFESFLSKKTKDLRSQVIDHKFWKNIENGTLDKKHLSQFILQDFWLVKQALKIDTLTIASMKSIELRDLLLQRLPKKINFQSLFDFGKGLGLSEKDFLNVKPLPGCMALTTYFFWMIDNTGDLEKIAAIDASKEVFSLLCVKVKPALKKYYLLTEKQVEFFTVHEEVAKKLNPVGDFIAKEVKTSPQKKLVEQAISLSYQFEFMFYDTLLSNAHS